VYIVVRIEEVNEDHIASAGQLKMITDGTESKKMEMGIAVKMKMVLLCLASILTVNVQLFLGIYFWGPSDVGEGSLNWVP
jgi:hypothetical protein